MILVDSSVWIDYFRGTSTQRTDRLDTILAKELIVVGDLIMTEVLQGFTRQSQFNQALRLLTSLTVVEIAGREIAIQAARNYRRLRDRGVTIRKTVDTLIATRCIEDGYTLLYSDRDFDPFVAHLDLRSAFGGTDQLQ
ncbi:MAG: PIN domain nuclease [Caulobacteraceae bacterium]